MTTIGNISLQEARALAKRYREAHSNPVHTPFYFLPKELLDILDGVPGIDGLKLYRGLTDEIKPREVLIMVPAHIVNRNTDNENWVDIVEYDYTINKGSKEEYTQQFNNTVFLVSGPCPPPPRGYTAGRVD